MENDFVALHKENLFAESLRQNGINSWIWNMSEGSIRFFNHTCKEVVEDGFFANQKEVFFENFPQGFVEQLHFVGDYRNRFMENVRKILKGENPFVCNLEFAIETNQENLIWLSVTGKTFYDENNNPEYVMGTWSDVTDKKINEQQLQQNSYLKGALVREAVYEITVNLEKDFFMADAGLEKWMEETHIFASTYDQTVREIASELILKEFRADFINLFSLKNLKTIDQDEPISIEYQRKYHGRDNWFRATFNIFQLDEFSDCWMYILVYDIDATKTKEIALEKMANTDALTGLYNRAHSIELMETHLRQHPKQQAAVIYLDLDNFKKVNDTLGHASGDSLLICVANAMTDYFGNDAIIGRIGGDEFILMHLNTDESFVAEMMRDFINKITNACQQNCPEIDVTASLGYVLYPQTAGDIKALAQYADESLYEAKRAGKNCAIQYKK